MNDQITRRQAEVLRALAHPLRLQIIKKLRAGPCCVCKIYASVGAEQSNVSHHLAILNRAEIVNCRKKGKWVWYQVSDARIFQIVDRAQRFLRSRLIKNHQSLAEDFLIKER